MAPEVDNTYPLNFGTAIQCLVGLCLAGFAGYIAGIQTKSATRLEMPPFHVSFGSRQQGRDDVTEKEHVIHLLGTHGYMDRLATFMIGPGEAFRRVEQFRHGPLSEAEMAQLEIDIAAMKHGIPNHWAIVNDYYLFSMPTKRGFHLSCFYVHGQTGEVDERVAGYTFRFDALP